MVSLKAHSRPGFNAPSQCASSRLRIVVLGYIVRGPIGGMAWNHLQYVLGLKQLGHEVLFLEESDDYPSCYDPSNHSIGTDPSYGLRFAERAFEKLGLQDCWAYLDAHLKDADVYAEAARHNEFFSFGELLEVSKSDLSNDGFDWHSTRQPIVLDAWPFSKGSAGSHFTTVMQWESYPAEEWNVQRLGMKRWQSTPSRTSTPTMMPNVAAHTNSQRLISTRGSCSPRCLSGRSRWPAGQMRQFLRNED